MTDLASNSIDELKVEFFFVLSRLKFFPKENAAQHRWKGVINGWILKLNLVFFKVKVEKGVTLRDKA